MGVGCHGPTSPRDPMIEKKLFALNRFVEWPLYVFFADDGGKKLDKISNKNGKFNRKRYLITDDSRCSCLSWMKVGNCKHLKAMRGDFSWTGNGVSAGVAVEYVSKIIENSESIFPSSRLKWWVAAEDFDDITHVITLRTSESLNFERMYFLVGERDSTFAVNFVYDPLEI